MVELSRINAVDVSNPSPLKTAASNLPCGVDDSVVSKFLGGPSPTVGREAVTGPFRCAQGLRGIPPPSTYEIEQHDQESRPNAGKHSDPLLIPVADWQGDVGHRGSSVRRAIASRVQHPQRGRSSRSALNFQKPLSMEPGEGVCDAPGSIDVRIRQTQHLRPGASRYLPRDLVGRLGG